MMAMMRRLGAALILASLTSCAALQPVSTGQAGSPLPSGPGAATATTTTTAPASDPSQVPAPPPRAAVPVGTTTSGGTIRSTGTTAAVVDSGPSKDAQRVLDSIPEPLPASERVAAPAVAGAAGVTAMAPEAAYDTLRAGATAGEDGVPAPAPTKPLGEQPGAAVVAGGAAAGAAAATPTVTDSMLAALTAAAKAPAVPDTCWRVQFAAPDTKERGDAVRAAAESQLQMPVVIEVEKKLYKVRTRDCMTRANADRVAARADAAGFDGAYRFQWKKP